VITKSVVLRCGVERAFALFTQHAGEWWPSDRRHTRDANSSIHIEPSGRFFERASDGSEVELGAVRMFEPPKRLVLDWFAGTGRDRPTHVEVLFEAVETGTRVTVVHRPGLAGEELFKRSAPVFERAWEAVLAALSARA
jgi:uncharacterized protein YndB with AHSA1/START domain